MDSCSIHRNHCLVCNTPLSILQIHRRQSYCSRICKSKSQKKKIILVCLYCKKEFSIYPYLKRKTNYCSRECYRHATRKSHNRICRICGKEFEALDCHIKRGFGIYCSRECQFVDYKRKRILFECKVCGKQFQLPPSVNKLKRFCSKKCKDDFERDYVIRICKNCHKEFSLPRWELNKGKGTFCSRDCYIKFNGETSIEEKIRKELQNKNIDFQQEVQIGKYHLDFLIPSENIVIECDGEYWHSLPKAQKRDKKKDEYLKSKGYLIYRFSEKEIKESAKNCLHQINI